MGKNQTELNRVLLPLTERRSPNAAECISKRSISCSSRDLEGLFRVEFGGDFD